MPLDPLKLRIVHINDHHSNLEAQHNAELVLDGVPTRVDLGGFARIASVYKEFAKEPSALRIHAGDAQTGTLYHTIYKGRADAALMNLVCFDTFTLGNHEFDYGDEALEGFLRALGSDPTCKTAVISANVRPTVGTPLAPADKPALLKPYAVREIQGVKVGIIGLTVKGKTIRSSRPLPSTEFLDELEAASAAVAQLRAQGVEHIVLASHFGYDNDIALVRRLPGIDVVIGGDSHSLLGSAALSQAGIPSVGPYPTQVTNADGAPVCVAQAWEYAKAVGVLDVAFDGHGKVLQCGGRVVLPIGDNFQRKDASGKWVAVPDAVSAALRARLAGDSEIRVTAPDAAAVAAVDGFKRELSTSLSRSIGRVPEALCHVRVPGTNPASQCGSQGSDVAQAVAEAFLAASRRAAFAIQNAGGVRVSVAQGDFTVDTAYRVLPFSNTLVEMELSGAEVKSALEDAVAFHLDPVQGVRGSDGAHPYAAGLRWALDLSKPRGNRFSQIELRDRSTGQWSALQPERRYTVVLNDFIASGKDGYTTLGKVYADRSRWVDTGLYYTQTFVDHISANQGVLQRLGPDRYAHQSVITPAGVPLR